MTLYKEIASKLMGLAEGDICTIPAKDMQEVSRIRSVLNMSCKSLGWKLVNGARYYTTTDVEDGQLFLFVNRPTANATKTVGEELADRLDNLAREDMVSGEGYIIVSNTLVRLASSELRMSKVGHL